MKWQSVSWSLEAERSLADALGSGSHSVRQEVEAGQASLWWIEQHGYFVTRLEGDGADSELVLVAWQGCNTGPLIDHLKGVCRQMGINSMRFHTAKPEKLVTRFVKKWDFAPVETVYRWENK